jgi:hypothetical protein
MQLVPTCCLKAGRRPGGLATYKRIQVSYLFLPLPTFCCVLCVPVSTFRPYVQLRACSKPAQAAAYLRQNINNMQLVLLYYIKAGRQAGYLQTQNSVLLSKR